MRTRNSLILLAAKPVSLLMYSCKNDLNTAKRLDAYVDEVQTLYMQEQ